MVNVCELAISWDSGSIKRQHKLHRRAAQHPWRAVGIARRMLPEALADLHSGLGLHFRPDSSKAADAYSAMCKCRVCVYVRAKTRKQTLY
jgi:hypothetical protein